MPARRLTTAFVRDVAPPNPLKGQQRQVTYIDTIDRGLALVLVVSYGGTKTFRVMTYVAGKAHTLKLGTYRRMTLDEAKAKARAHFANPRKPAELGSFKEVAENWLKRHVEKNRLRTQAEIRRHLTTYVYPKWQDHKFLDIRRRQVIELLDHLEDKHGTAQADAVLGTLRSLMAWQQSRDEDYTSPIVKGMARDRRHPRDRARKRILTDDEIRAVWQACADAGAYGALVKVLLLTAQRKAKVMRMRWDDVVDGVWLIRTEAREKGTAGQLPLPSMVLDIIAQQPRLMGNPYVFAGPRGKGPLFSFARYKEELDRKLPAMEPWVLHDLRRTARSLLSRAGVLPHIAERVLGHAIVGIEGVYDRHSYEAEKAGALNELAGLVDRILNPSDNVVPMRASKKPGQPGPGL